MIRNILLILAGLFFFILGFRAIRRQSIMENIFDTILNVILDFSIDAPLSAMLFGVLLIVIGAFS